MKNYLSGILLCFMVVNAFSQSDSKEMHQQFLRYLKEEKVDSIYNAYLEIDENDEAYEQALLYRNQYGWVLNKVEQLKKDIPAFLRLTPNPDEMGYGKVFNPQEFPSSEWHRFYEMAVELEQSFDENSIEYRELLGMKTLFEFITKNDKALLVDLPKLLDLLDKESKLYSRMLWQYGNTLVRSDKKEKAEKVFEEGLTLSNGSHFLGSIILLYSYYDEFEKVLKYEEMIVKDKSASLLYSLGEACLESRKKKKAKKYFDSYTAEFEYVDYEPYVQIVSENTVYSIPPHQLEVLGDFYFKRDKKLSCKYYTYADKLMRNMKDDEKSFNKALIAVHDENQRKKMTEEFEKAKKNYEAFMVRIGKKLAKCK